MLKKIVFAGFALFCCNLLLATLPSCFNPKSYEERCTPETCFYADSLRLEIYNEGWGQTISPINNYAYATDLRFEVSIQGSHNICYKPSPKRNKFSLMSQAYALSYADCNIFMRGDSVIGYAIYSDATYDTLHPAGTSLNDLITAEGFPVKAYNNNGKTETNPWTFKLNIAPADTGRHVFTIKVAQANGDTISVSSQQIKLVK